MIRLPPSSTRTDTRSPSTTLFRSLVDGGVAGSDRAPEIVRAVAEVQSSLAGSLGPVAVPERGDDGPVVAGEGLEGVVGHTFSEKLRSRAEEGVAADDAVVEEGQGLARLHGLHPEADLAELDRYLVCGHAVEAGSHQRAQIGGAHG